MCIRDRYDDNTKGTTPAATDWTTVAAVSTTSSAVSTVRIVKYSLSDNKVTKIQLADTIKANDTKLDVVTGTATKITKNGYLAASTSYKLSDSVKIFAAPYISNKFEFDDTDELSVVTKASVLGSDINAYQAIINKDKNEVVAMLIDNDTASNDQYGIATGKSTISVNGSAKDGVSFYIDGTEYKDQEFDKVDNTTSINSLKVMDDSTTSDGIVLYKIKKTSAGKYSFTTPNSSNEKSVTTAAGISVSPAAVKVTKMSSDRVTLNNGNILNIASNVVIYTYDKSADKTTVSDYSSRLDVISDDVLNVAFYTNMDPDSDNYKLVDYIVIYQK